jgi:hypothetical protein
LILKPIQPLRQKPGSSALNAIGRAVQPGDIDVLETVGGVQDHPRALDSPERQSDRGRPSLKLGSLCLGKLDHVRADPGHNT